MKNKKVKNALNLPEQITRHIPYLQVFADNGLIEIEQGRYSRGYVISDVEAANLKGFSSEYLSKVFELLLNTLPGDVCMQFSIHNKFISQDDFVKKVLVMPNKGDILNGYINEYNKIIAENVKIGHNNVRKLKYFTLSLYADCVSDAEKRFNQIDAIVHKAFENIYKINVSGLSSSARLKIIHSMYNPKSNDFGAKADLRHTGEFSFKDMKKLKLTTKDCVGCSSLDIQSDYIELNKDTFVRAFFIASVPAKLTSSLITDITNISSNMILSAFYEPVDAAFGFDVFNKRVAENTEVKRVSKRDTIEDRKNKATIEIRSLIKEDEEAYFNLAALNVFKECVASNSKAMFASFTICLYADSLEELERDTKLLHISTSKFACQVKSLDLQQIEGLKSVLPLANVFVDTKRLFPATKLSRIPMLGIEEVLQKDGLYNGLNSINDNLVLLNRKNFTNLSGIIAGTEHCGKTYQNKREIFNALISGNDKVVVVAVNNEYDDFIKNLGGEIVTINKYNPFATEDKYGLTDSDRDSKAVMLKALFEACTRKESNSFSDNMSIYDITTKNSEETERLNAIDSEITALFDTLESSNRDINDLMAVMDICKDGYPFTKDVFKAVNTLIGEEVKENTQNRLLLYKVNSLYEKIMLLNHLWNNCIKDRKSNIATWFFIEEIDDMLESEYTTDFLLDFIKKCNLLQTVSTFVIQSSVKLFTTTKSMFRLEELINAVGYHKLLSQGAIERKKYAEILNISNSLVNYISNAELGNGIILTPATSVAFTDLKNELSALFSA